MLQRLRESLSLILLALLPLHAMFVTVGTHLLSDLPHSPLTFIVVWKELLLFVILVIAFVEILREGKLRSLIRFDLIDACILAAILLAVAVSINHPSAKMFLLGFKYDFLPLCAFFILRRLDWSRHFLPSAARTLIMVGVVVAAFGLLTLFIPMQFFTALGYSDLHSLYRPGAPLAAFQFLEGSSIRRIQSVMSGPNQLGLWLILPFAANLYLLLKSLKEKRKGDMALYLVGILLITVAIIVTYSRSAWIAVIVVTALSFAQFFSAAKKPLKRKMFGVSAVVVSIVVVLGVLFAPKVLIRTESLKGHLEKPIEAFMTMKDHPFGLGLGSAGPASNRMSDTCFFGKTEADVVWAKDRTDICVFVANVQKSPENRACNCPVLTENWYLQWGVEMGWLGLILSLVLPALILWQRKLDWPLVAFIGVSVAGIFLHSFEDSAVGYSLWLLLAASVLQARGPNASL